MPRVPGPSPADHRPGLVKHFPEGGLGTSLAIEEQRIEGNAHHKVPPQTIGGSGAGMAKLDPAQVDGPPGLGITRPDLDRLLSGMGALDRWGLDFRELVPRPGG